MSKEREREKIREVVIRKMLESNSGNESRKESLYFLFWHMIPQELNCIQQKSMI